MIMWHNFSLVAMVDIISRSYRLSFVHTQGLECFLLCGGFQGWCVFLFDFAVNQAIARSKLAQGRWGCFRGRLVGWIHALGFASDTLVYGLVQFNRMQLLFILLQDCTLVSVNVQRSSASVRVHRVVHNHYNFSSRNVQTESQKCCVCSFCIRLLSW